jgi:hypothetical protein
MKKEIWKDVFNYEGMYEVSNLGNVKSLDRIIIDINGVKYLRKGRVIKARIGKDGNARINLSKDGIKITHSLARVVYKAFNPYFDYYDNDLIIDHKNNKGEDNKLENLYLINRYDPKTPIKEKRKVKCITTGREFESTSDAERYYNIEVGSGSISRCCSGKQKHAVILEDGTKLQWEYVDK